MKKLVSNDGIEVTLTADYTRKCKACGNSPVVTGITDKGEKLLDTELCGPCTWGDHEALDPKEW